ncbi:MAG: (2Fe-2S)-binding protein [Acidobacteriota bacterium]|nr:MAG: (2Fe-2S)-binding protein [Acidobacteriota bacterium]
MSSSDERHDNPGGLKENGSGVSRRNFLKGSSVALTIPLVAGGEKTVRAAGADVPVLGPGKVDITLNINGAARTASVEPRVTLLDALRNDLDLTGAKRVCDRATCGACTVIMDGNVVYACSVLAIEAQGRKIQTVEGLEQNGRLHPVQQAFVDNDAQQCGFCTPGFVMSCKNLLDKHPSPTPEQMQMGLGGNLCRCGTYAGIKAAVAQAARTSRRGGRRNG